MKHFETGSKKGRGMAQQSLDLIEAMRDIAEQAHPITGRGVGYKLFTGGLIPSMAKSEMARVYRLLKEAREEGLIEWEWIVDEGRQIERVSTWSNPAAYARCVARSYRRDFWNQQPHRVQVWSEKGTIVEQRRGSYSLPQLAAWLDQSPQLLQRTAKALAESNPWLALAQAQICKAPINVERRLGEMQYHGPGENGIHLTQLSVSAALLRRGWPVDDVVLTLLDATVDAAGREGQGWDWTAEERDIRQMCATWLAKHPRVVFQEG